MTNIMEGIKPTRKLIDLHTHSTNLDGEQTLEEAIR